MSEPDLFKNTVARTDRLWLVRPGAIAGIIHGQLPNKSNSKQIVMVGPRGNKRAMVIKSPEARAYGDQFEEACWRSARYLSPIDPESQLYFKALVYVDNMRRDLDVELLPDLIQKSGIIKNDKAMWDKHYRRAIDNLNPRVEFLVAVWTEEMKAVPFWEPGEREKHDARLQG